MHEEFAVRERLAIAILNLSKKSKNLKLKQLTRFRKFTRKKDWLGTYGTLHTTNGRTVNKRAKKEYLLLSKYVNLIHCGSPSKMWL